jgi:protein required for attachment to host cells
VITRIVVADQTEARFFDSRGFALPLLPAGSLRNPGGRMRERDLVSDRPGRVFNSARAAHRRRGATTRHASGGEHPARRHLQQVFARRTALELERARQAHRFDRLVVVAPPEFLGRIRAALPAGLRAKLVASIPRDLVHLDADVRAYLPRHVFATWRNIP